MNIVEIVVTGAKGQLGQALAEVLTQDLIYLTDLPDLDLRSYWATMDYFRAIRPELVIHCAANTRVDDCELQPDEAYQGNVIATRNVVNACQEIDAALVYVSTDYVFDGEGHAPYHEYDMCNPINVYGKTKWQGEEIVKTHLRRFYIARTAWLFGDSGSNFIKTVMKLAMEMDTLKVVNDQYGSPTYAVDLAWAIHQLIRTGAYGIYHITNEGSCSWFDFARQILEMAEMTNKVVEPVATGELNRPAPRPRYSVLGKEGLKSLGIEMPSYQEALKHYFRRNPRIR